MPGTGPEKIARKVSGQTTGKDFINGSFLKCYLLGEIGTRTILLEFERKTRDLAN